METPPFNSHQTTQSAQSCCIATALEEADATYCIECGKPLLRCMAFQECGGIVDDSGLCPVCVQTQLLIRPGATLHAAIGGSVALPFDLVNASQVDRPLFVKGLWSRERKGEWRKEQLGWEKLAPRERAPASVTANLLDNHGLHEVDIMWAVATQWRTREEHFAFSTSVLLEIPDRSQDRTTNIQISAEKQQGNVIQIHDNDRTSSGSERLVEAINMKVKRVDLDERRLGLRSIDGRQQFCRSAVIEFLGFADGEAPSQATPIVTSDAMLVFGRAHTRAQGGEADVRLLVRKTDGELDEQRSLAISRRHFEIYAENDRPVLRVAGGNGLRVNGKAYGPDKKIMLGEGDVIAPLVDDPLAISIHVLFRRELDNVTRLILSRSPQMERAQ